MYYLQPTGDLEVGTWNTPPLYSKIDSYQSDEFIYSSADPNNDMSIIQLSTPLNTGISYITGVKLDYTYRGFVNNQFPVDLEVGLMQGSEKVYSEWVIGITGIELFSGNFNIPPIAVANMTGYNDLKLFFNGSMSNLNSGLVAYWPMDEIGGVRYDKVNNIPLTDNNTVGSTSGVINSGALILGPEGEYLSTYHPLLNVQSGDAFTTTCWLYSQNYATDWQYILGTLKQTSPTYSIVWRDGGFAGFLFVTGLEPSYWDGYRFAWVTQSVDGTISYNKNSSYITGRWMFLAVRNDPENLVYKLNVNGIQGTGFVSTVGVSMFNKENRPFKIGQSDWYDAFTSGTIDEVGHWKRQLSDNELVQLYNYGLAKKYPFEHTTLVNGLTNYWTMDETGYIKMDSIGNTHLRSLYFSPIVTGKIGYSTSGKIGYVADNPVDVNPNSGSFTWAGWIYPTSTGVYSQVLLRHYLYDRGGFTAELNSKAENIAISMRTYPSIEYEYVNIFQITPANGHLLNNWHFIVFGYNKEQNTLFSSISGLAKYNQNKNTNIGEIIGNVTESKYRLNTDLDTPNSYDYSGYMDEVGFWNRALTDGEISMLYNNGRGRRPYDYHSLINGLISYWKMGETGGVRYDSIGTRYWSDINTVEQYKDRLKYGALINGDNLEALEFNETDGPIKSGSFTITMWVKNINTYKVNAYLYEAIYNGNSAILIRFNDDGGGGNKYFEFSSNVAFGGIGGNILDSKHIPNTQSGYWEFVALSHNNDTQTCLFYKDKYGVTATATGKLNYDKMKFLRYADDTAVCAVREAGLWNRALTSGELDFIYNNGIGRYYPFSN